MGTNDLNSDKSSELIVKSIADVGPSLKNESRDASKSSITLRNDKLKEKAAEVNDYLMKWLLCTERNVYFINHAKNILAHYLNKNRL